MSIDGWKGKPNMTSVYNRMLFSLQNQGNSDTCCNMDGPWGHHIKQNKPVTKKKTLYCFTYVKYLLGELMGFPGGSDGKESACDVGDPGSNPGSGRSPGREDPLEKEVATHSNILAWRIPWTEEPGGYSSQGHKESDTTEQLTHMRYLN